MAYSNVCPANGIPFLLSLKLVINSTTLICFARSMWDERRDEGMEGQWTASCDVFLGLIWPCFVLSDYISHSDLLTRNKRLV